MKSVSFWAKHNTFKARLLIVLSEIFLFVLAVRLGLLLLHSGIRPPGIAVAVPVSVFSAGILIARYGKTLQQPKSRRYQRQRLSFFLVGLAMFLLTTFLVCSEKLLTWNTYPSLSGTGVSLLMKPAPAAGSQLSAAQAKKAARLLKKMRKNDGLKWLYVFLVILGGLFFLSLIASLSCTLSCNGNGALAVLVLLLGGGGIIFLCAWLIRKILKGKAARNTQPASVDAAPENGGTVRQDARQPLAVAESA